MELKRNIYKARRTYIEIKYMHVGTIQVLIKSTFQEGINSPMEQILKDDGITYPIDKNTWSSRRWHMSN